MIENNLKLDVKKTSVVHVGDGDAGTAVAMDTNKKRTMRNKRKEALAKLDNAKFGWFHVRACVVSGIGFFTVSTSYSTEFTSHNYKINGTQISIFT